ncbi:hypothetical protein GCM10009738_50380 [Kitasatospora viridis]
MAFPGIAFRGATVRSTGGFGSFGLAVDPANATPGRPATASAAPANAAVVLQASRPYRRRPTPWNCPGLNCCPLPWSQQGDRHAPTTVVLGTRRSNVESCGGNSAMNGVPDP